jgi:hypothetical protein
LTYNQEQLERLDHTELNIAVEKVVFGRTPLVTLPRGYVCCPDYSGQWMGFGLVVERMRELGWNYDVDATAPELGIDVCFHPKNPAFRAKGVGSTLPRAAVIAAILAIQGAL